MSTTPCRFQPQAICDRIGYTQHVSECWADVIQQILFFADGFRETTQRLFYFITDAEIEDLVDTYLEDVQGLFAHKSLYAHSADVKHRNDTARENMIDVLQLFRTRFKSHYDFLTCDNPTTSEVCVPPQLLRDMYMSMTSQVIDKSDMFGVKELLLANRETRQQNMPILRRQISGQSSIRSAKLLTGKETTWAPVGFTIPAFEVLIKLCKVPAVILPLQKVPEESILQAIVVDLFPVYMVTIASTTMYAKNFNHVTGFLKCNGKWFYYDDESGIYPVDKELIDYLVENTKRLAEENIRVCIKVIKGVVCFLLIREIQEFETSMSSDKNNEDNYEILSVWYNLRMTPLKSRETPEYKYLKTCVTKQVTISGGNHVGYCCYNYVTSMHMVTLPSKYVENQAKTSAYVAAGQMVTSANNEIAAKNQDKSNRAIAYKTMMAPYESVERRNTTSRRRIVRRRSIRRRRPMKN